jgi:hypothetical protein
VSYTLQPIAVDLDVVRKVIGSKDRKLLARLKKELAEDLEQVDSMLEDYVDEDEGEEPLTTADVLQHLILGEPYSTAEGVGFAYGYCFGALCDHYGEMLDNDHWSAMRYPWFDAVQKALEQAGVTKKQFAISALVERGAPVKLPEIDDFPGLGYLTKTEVVKARDVLSKGDLTKIADREAVESIEQVRQWLDACARSDRDLVCTYS